MSHTYRVFQKFTRNGIDKQAFAFPAVFVLSVSEHDGKIIEWRVYYKLLDVGERITDDLYKEVLEYGKKLPKDLAKTIFPDQEGRYAS